MTWCAFLLAFGASHAQQWCTPGATWRSWTSGSQSELYTETTCVGDTIVQGLQGYRTRMRKVGVDAFLAVDTVLHGFVVVDGDILWYAKGGIDPVELDTLAWFGAGVGAHWNYELPGEVTPSVRATVTGVGVRDIGTIPLRYVSVDLTGALWSGPTTDTIYERIGPLAIDKVDPLTTFSMEVDHTGLICYHDEEVEWIGPGVFPNGCYAPLDTGPDIPSRTALMVGPGSDGAGVVIVHPAATSDGYWSVLDALGRVAGTGSIAAGTERTRVPVAALVAGTYLLRFQWPDRTALVRVHHP